MWYRLTTSRSARATLGLVVVVLAFAWILPSFASYGDVAQTLAGADRRFAAPLLVVSAFNLAAPALLQRAALPGLRLIDAVLVDWITSAVTNTVPGGSAVAVGMTWSMYRARRLTGAAIARSIVVTGVGDQMVKLSAPLLAVLWLSTQRPVGPGLLQAAAAGGVLFTVVIGLSALLVVGDRAAGVMGRLVDRLPLTGTGWVERFERLRTDTVELVQSRWRGLTLWTLAGHLNLFLLLLLCLRAVGVERTDLSAAAVFAALAFGRLVTALPLTPGGLGVMEVGLTGALAAAGTAPEAAVVAAVLMFRFVTFALPVPLGALSSLLWATNGDASGGGLVPEHDQAVLDRGVAVGVEHLEGNGSSAVASRIGGPDPHGEGGGHPDHGGEPAGDAPDRLGTAAAGVVDDGGDAVGQVGGAVEDDVG